VLSDPYYNERVVWLDNEPTPILKANLAFMAIALPAGSHEVRLGYSPNSFMLGLTITSISLVVSLALLLIGRWQKTRGPKTALQPES